MSEPSTLRKNMLLEHILGRLRSEIPEIPCALMYCHTEAIHCKFFYMRFIHHTHFRVIKHNMKFKI